MHAKTWPRSAYQRHHKHTAFDLICVARQSLDLKNGSPASVAGWSTSPSLHDGVDISVDAKPWSSAWGAWLKQQSLEPDHMEPAIADAVRAMTVAYWVEVNADDSPDLSALQDAWAAARWLVALGAVAVFDASAGRWWSADELRSWDAHRGFAISRELREISMRGPSFEIVLTRGMDKFGRSDILLHLPDGLPAPIQTNARHLLRALCHRQALGEVLTPGGRVDSGFLAGDLVPYRSGVMDLGFEPAPDTLVLLPVLG